MIAMEQCKKDEVMKGYKRTNNLKILNDFIESEMDCVKLTGWKHVSACSCASALKKSIQRFKMTSITVVTIKGEVYLIKK